MTGALHPLGEARADQEAAQLKANLSELLYQGIVELLERGSVHADDLEPTFPTEHRALCRRLTGAQFGSLASRHYIFEKERRKSTVPSRKGAKSGVYEFTRLGREKLAGVSTGVPTPQGSGASASTPLSASADPGDSSSGVWAGTSSEEPARLFDLPAVSAITSQEAA